MNKLITTIFLLAAWTGLFAQRTVLPDTSIQSPSYLNIKNNNGYQLQGRLVANDSCWLNGAQILVPNGNVGIGTITPVAKLHVAISDTTGIEIAHFENNSDNAIMTVHSHADSSAFYLLQTGSFIGGIALNGITKELVFINGLGAMAIEIDTVNNTLFYDSLGQAAFEIHPEGDAAALKNFSISNGTTSQGKLYLVEDLDNGTNTVTLKSPASLAASYDITLPPDNGNTNEVLTTDGSGVTSWTNVGGWTVLNDSTISRFNGNDTLTITSIGGRSSIGTTNYLGIGWNLAENNITMQPDSVKILVEGFEVLKMTNDDIRCYENILPANSGIQNLGTASNRWNDGLINSIYTSSINDNNSTVNTTASDTATINAISGRFRKDATGAAFTLTNSYISTASIILLTPANAAIDVTATTWTVAAASGSATITFNATPTANFDMNFLVIN